MDTVAFTKWLVQLNTPNLPTWSEFPDFELYMDQLVNLGNRYLDNLIDTPITSSMINSYVKKGLMQRPIKKKYHAAHIAELIVISLLKNIYSLEMIRQSIKEAVEYTSVENAYNYFANTFNQTMIQIKKQQKLTSFEDIDANDITFTEHLAIRAVIYKMISTKLFETQHNKI
ncbi:DUF1836 domain-containing protein [Ligilactobacillus sp. WILCCON 0076]|uniref:DUF1836 domain-containing protein n=1 Tax=Ligilactobacillus ubinensis TaxID=2876789 RepID=A0A9X2JL81_9LACO|nr:DUF1836 domain-containing protein [Ligilactobacillus ubinensis]MCP0886305.1 DUF1836 domain-containing protein [Ligilactobacillus ubinensis]